MAKSIFQTIPYSLLHKVAYESNNKEYGVNFLIDDPHFQIAHIIDCSKKMQTDFIFSLSAAIFKEQKLETLFQKLYALFTVSAFAGRPVVDLPFLNVNSTEKFNDCLNRLVSYFKDHGETLNIIQPDLSGNTTNKILLLNEADVRSLSAEQSALYYMQDIEQVILLSGQYTDESQMGTLLSGAAIDNKHVDLLFSKVALAGQLALQNHQKDLWRKRAQLYLSFLTLSKEIGEDQYYGIKQWYHKEYEVLPLWYKQFGHIIKVLSGKRSFKSLFNKQ